MKVTVVGAGAVGGYFGGRLQEAGVDVTFLVRPKRAEQLKQTGLVIKSSLGDAKLPARIATSPDEIEQTDVIILGLKNYHLASALDSIRPLVQRGAKVMPLLNGVEHFTILQNEFGKEAVLGGLCQIIVTLDRDGAIVHTGQMQNLTFGPLVEEQAELCQEFERAASGVNFRLTRSDNVLQDIWGKYAFITAFSGATTASRLPIDEVLKVEATKHVFAAALTEMTALSSAHGVPLPESFVESTVQRMYKMPPGSTSSMHQDFRKELALEVESLQGAAVRLAKQAGIEIPAIQTLYGLIKPYERLQLR